MTSNKKKPYQVRDNRIMSPNYQNLFTNEMTYDELIETITDDNCGLDVFDFMNENDVKSQNLKYMKIM